MVEQEGLQFVGEVAEMTILIGDVLTPTGKAPAVMMSGMKGTESTMRPLKGWEVEVLTLRALSIMAQQKGLAEDPPSPIMLAR